MQLRISHSSALSLVVLVAFLGAALSLGCANRSTPAQASTTYHTRDWNGKTVTVRVPSQAVTDIKDTDVDGTVRATITRVDAASQRVRVRTSEGQTIVLAMAPEALGGLKVGDRILLSMPGAPRT